MQLPEYMRQLDGLAGGYQRAQILYTALRLNFFAQLETPVSAEAVAAAAGVSERGARMLLEGLVAVDLVEKVNGLFRNKPVASACLVPGAPMDQTHILAHKGHGWAAWSDLDTAVKTGQSVSVESDRNPEELRAFILGMHDIAQDSARGLIEVLDLSPYKRLLDLGGGPGSYTIAFLQANSTLTATILDMPQVVPIGREVTAAAGLADRIAFVPGDMRETPFPEGHDLIFISNIIHSFDAETNRKLVKKCHDALTPGGTLIVKDFLLDEGRTGPAFSLIFALHMFVHTEAGDTYTIGDVKGWAEDAGFASGELLDLTPQSRLWIARKTE